MNLPQHPDDDHLAPSDTRAASRTTWVIVAAVVGVVAVMVVLHLTGAIGGGLHGGH